MASRKVITATDAQYSGTLVASLNEQRTNGRFCDVTIIVEDIHFRAHRNILSASCTYFRHLFSAVTDQEVKLSFVRAEVFTEILNYVYSSKIVDVCADLLEELINSGQLLGVSFIADLGVRLSQKKSLTGGVKINTAEPSASVSCQKLVDIEKAIKEQPVLKKDSGNRTAVVNTAAVAVPINEHKELGKPADCKNKPLGSENKEVRLQPAISDTVKVSSQQMSIHSIDSDQALSTAEAKSAISNIVPLNSNPLSQTNSCPVTVSDPGQTQTDNIASCAVPVPSKTSVLDHIVSCSEPVPSETLVLGNIVSHSEPRSSKIGVLENTEMAQQKMTPSMIELSTYQTQNDGFCSEISSPNSGVSNNNDGSPDSKRVKLKHEDHYELNVDRKEYICSQCMKSYASQTSLQRHKHVHSPEKKFKCCFCEKVFALAEYRKRHEKVHTRHQNINV